MMSKVKPIRGFANSYYNCCRERDLQCSKNSKFKVVVSLLLPNVFFSMFLNKFSCKQQKEKISEPKKKSHAAKNK